VTPPRVAVVVVSFNTRDLTLAALASAFSSEGVAVEAWVVDNASTDGSPAAVRERFPAARVIELRENVGFGRANNHAFEQLDAPWVLLLNSDATLAEPDGLARLVATLDRHPEAAVAGPRLQDPSGRLEHSARAFPSVLEELMRGSGLHPLLPAAARERTLAREQRDHQRAGPADWLTGACLLVRGDVLRDVGGFDPRIFLYGEELDWCWRVREAGWDIRLEPSVTVVHWRGASGGSLTTSRQILSMAGDAYVVRKHRGPAYLGGFAAARVVGLAMECALQGLAGLLGGGDGRRARARHAASALVAWVAALARGGARDPASPRVRGVRSKGRSP